MGAAYVDFALARPGMFRLMFSPLIAKRELYPELKNRRGRGVRAAAPRRAVASAGRRRPRRERRRRRDRRLVAGARPFPSHPRRRAAEGERRGVQAGDPGPAEGRARPRAIHGAGTLATARRRPATVHPAPLFFLRRIRLRRRAEPSPYAPSTAPEQFMGKPRTLYDKIWDDHVVETKADGTSLLYIDRHLVHEVTSPQAFEGLRLAGRKVRAPEKTLAVVDHNVPTTDRSRRHRRSREPPAGRAARRERARIRHRILQRVRPAPGHRPHHRPGAGLHPAGHDDRLRRQPHLDPRRLRRARPRHRHQRGRACAGDADADPDEGQEHARRRRRRAGRRRRPPRTSSSPSSARSARRAAPATSSNMPARRSARCRWKAA